MKAAAWQRKCSCLLGNISGGPMADKQDKIKYLLNASARAWDSNDADEVIRLCSEVVSIDPQNYAAYSNMGTALWALQRPEESYEMFSKSLSIKPDYMEALLNMGTLCHDRGELEEAEEFYKKATELRPFNSDLTWRTSIIALARGDYLRGWALYDEGLGVPNIRGKLLEFNQLPWDGNTCNHLLICHEQGFGDSLQFIRYAELCKKVARKVYVLCPKPLHKILSSCPWIDGVMERAHDGDFEQYVYTLSLPHIFKTTLETVPANIPYLFASEAAKTKWRGKFEGMKGLRVGLCWAGNPRRDNIRYRVSDAKRSMGLNGFVKLLDLPVNFISLQKDNFEGVENYPQIINWMDEVNDFDDTAAIMENLDLVISVDTSVVHLAGALGRPVWVLSRFDACWRWLRNRVDSPWYPNAKVYGQPKPGDWDSVTNNIYNDLKALT